MDWIETITEKPKKISIYKGWFPSGIIRFTYFDCKTGNWGKGKLGVNYIPLVEPIKWRKLNRNEFYQIIYLWDVDKKYLEEDLILN